jgi:hypothetical protein
MKQLVKMKLFLIHKYAPCITTGDAELSKETAERLSGTWQRKEEDIGFEKLEDIAVKIKPVTFPDRSTCYFLCSGPLKPI